MPDRTGSSLIEQRAEAAQIADLYDELARSRTEIDLKAARLLRRMERIGGWDCVASSSAADFGERLGISALEVRNQLLLGRALEVEAALEEKVRSRAIPVASAALLGRVLSDKRLLREGDDWIGWAEGESSWAFRRRVQKRREELALGELVVPLHLHVASKALDDFNRCREILSRKAGVPVTRGQTFGLVTDAFLDEHDEERVEPGKRRMPDTATLPGRGVPAEVKREVRARQPGRCAVPFCDNSIYLEYAHLKAYRLGGSQEAVNILRACGKHHGQLDKGYLRITGPAERPSFTDYGGRDLSRRCAPPGKTDGWQGPPTGTQGATPGGTDPP
jgi:hypothetical protein